MPHQARLVRQAPRSVGKRNGLDFTHSFTKKARGNAREEIRPLRFPTERGACHDASSQARLGGAP